MLSSYTDEFKDKYLLKEYDFQVRHFEWYELYIDFTKKLIHRPSHWFWYRFVIWLAVKQHGRLACGIFLALYRIRSFGDYNQNLNAMQSTMYFGGFVARSINSFAIFKCRTLTPPLLPMKNILSVVQYRMGLGTQILGLSNFLISFTPGVFAK